MKKENQKVEKLCSFYVSDWHFATMLLPYINHKIEEQINVITLLENNIQENIVTLVKKLNGVEVSREILSNDTYQPMKAIIRRGPGIAPVPESVQ